MISTLIKVHARKLTAICMSLIFLISSCATNDAENSSETAPTKSEINHIYSHLLKGRYADYVKHIASCKDKPRFYREQMVNIHRIHAQQREAEMGKIDSISINRIETHSDTRHATIYLTHHYSNAPAEEVLLQMVYTENQWMIK